MNELIELNDITSRIYTIRGAKVMLDRDLAELYDVETRIIKRNVRRHLKRFPADFMFELSNQEFKSLRSQFGISKRGGTRFMPMAFSEQGVAMLACVLNSDRAIDINIQIMRAFVQMRHIAFEHSELKRQVEALRNQTEERFTIVFEVLDKLVSDEKSSHDKIGFIKKG